MFIILNQKTIKKLIVIITLLLATNFARAIDVTVNNNLLNCLIDITITPLDGACMPTGTSPSTATGVTPGNGFAVVDPAALVFQIDITVWDGGTPHTIATIYTSNFCGPTTNSTVATLNCNNSFVATATLAPGGGPSYVVNVN